ncbi:MAG: hypothetical protein KDA87_16700 [Planctomycetales bacterium]|nr:hypothetical protein [Planctomycetales bacterium]
MNALPDPHRETDPMRPVSMAAAGSPPAPPNAPPASGPQPVSSSPAPSMRTTNPKTRYGLNRKLQQRRNRSQVPLWASLIGFVAVVAITVGIVLSRKDNPAQIARNGDSEGSFATDSADSSHVNSQKPASDSSNLVGSGNKQSEIARRPANTDNSLSPQVVHPEDAIGAMPSSGLQRDISQGNSTMRSTPDTDAAMADNVGSNSEAADTTLPPLRLLNAEQTRQLGQSLRQAKRQMTNHAFDAAAESLQTARELANGSEHADLVERLAALNSYAQGFWETVNESIPTLEGTEVHFQGGNVFVVEVNAQTITIRQLGENRSLDREQLPDDFVLAIANRWFDPTAASTPVYRGAFFALRPNGKRQALAEWKLAVQNGANIGDLMDVLDDDYDLKSMSDGQK